MAWRGAVISMLTHMETLRQKRPRTVTGPSPRISSPRGSDELISSTTSSSFVPQTRFGGGGGGGASASAGAAGAGPIGYEAESSTSAQMRGGYEDLASNGYEGRKRQRSMEVSWRWRWRGVVQRFNPDNPPPPPQNPPSPHSTHNTSIDRITLRNREDTLQLLHLLRHRHHLNNHPCTHCTLRRCVPTVLMIRPSHRVADLVNTNPPCILAITPVLRIHTSRGLHRIWDHTTLLGWIQGWQRNTMRNNLISSRYVNKPLRIKNIKDGWRRGDRSG